MASPVPVTELSLTVVAQGADTATTPAHAVLPMTSIKLPALVDMDWLYEDDEHLPFRGMTKGTKKKRRIVLSIHYGHFLFAILRVKLVLTRHTKPNPRPRGCSATARFRCTF
jgi:hypothetical protein